MASIGLAPSKKTGAAISHVSQQSERDRFARIATELLRAGLGVRFRAAGRSMYPTIREGEAITVEPVAPAKVRRGDIILCRGESSLVAHRVVRIDADGAGARAFILRGDALRSCAEAVPPDQVFGRVVRVERNGRPIALDTRRTRVACSVDIGLRRLKARLAHLVARFCPNRP